MKEILIILQTLILRDTKMGSIHLDYKKYYLEGYCITVQQVFSSYSMFKDFFRFSHSICKKGETFLVSILNFIVFAKDKTVEAFEK